MAVSIAIPGPDFSQNCSVFLLLLNSEDGRVEWRLYLINNTFCSCNVHYWLLHLANVANLQSHITSVNYFAEGTNLVFGPPEKFYRRNPSGTFRDVHWYHLGDPKKVPGTPSQCFLIFLGFDKNITKIEIWLSYPHFWADFQVSYHFGKLLTARSQGFTASKNQSLDQWDMSITKMKILTP